jgi:hypothetical protein
MAFSTAQERLRAIRQAGAEATLGLAGVTTDGQVLRLKTDIEPLGLGASPPRWSPCCPWTRCSAATAPAS